MGEVRIADERTLTSLQQLRDARPAMIFYSIRTCWWTANPDDLCCPEGHPMKDCEYRGIPLDPAGAPLCQTDDIDAFLREAEVNPSHYGRHGLEAFILAYHGNIVSEEGLPRCATKWDSYNSLLDTLAERGSGGTDLSAG